MTIEVIKGGTYVVAAAWGNVGPSLVKEGFYLLTASFPNDGVASTKVAQSVVVYPIPGFLVADVNNYALFQQNEQVRVATIHSYVIFRPTPQPPRKTVVIVGPGVSFGGSGIANPLIGAIEQEQEVTGAFYIPQNLSGNISQDSTLSADLFVDDSTVDQFLEGAVVQISDFSTVLKIPHNLSGISGQESIFDADLFVDTSSVDHFLEGDLIQTTAVAGSIAIVHSLVGEVEQESTFTSDMTVISSNIQGSVVQSSALSGDIEEPPATHRYWRLSFVSNNVAGGASDAYSVSEIETFDAADVDVTPDLSMMSADSSYSGAYVASKSVDGNLSTFWSGAANGGVGSNAWLKMDYGAGNEKDLRRLRMYPRADAFITQSPTEFNIQYSDDNSSWTTVRNVITTWPSAAWQEWTW